MTFTRFESDAMESERESIEATADSGASALSTAGLTQYLMGSAADEAGEIRPGATFGDVTIIRFVAEGGMGRVYEGIQDKPRRSVAVKVVRQGAVSPAALKRFENEAHLLGRLTHPGIARIYSVGRQPFHGRDLPYFVMEYIDGALSITAYAAARDLSTRDRVRLFCEACRAVAHGHQKGVMHRDLKPGNILVDAAGHPKIIDFGVARSIDGDVALTSMHTGLGQLVGTVQYMCPEQFDAVSEDLDVRADVYALGVVLYELLVGRLPYDVAKRPVYEVARVVKDVEPTSLSTVEPKMRGDLNTIVAKCLEKDRARRYSSAAELEADLDRYLRGEPIVASPPGLFDSIARLARRHTLAATAAAGILAAILVGGAGMSIFAVQAARDREAALHEKARADDEAETSRQRLYVANLRSLQACLNTGNLRMARQVHADNLAIVGMPAPLEMNLLGAGLDDALVVLDESVGPVLELAYSPDGRTLGVTTLEKPNGPPGEEMRAALFGHPSAMQSADPGRVEHLFYAVGDRQEYARLREPGDADAWVRSWRSGKQPVLERSNGIDPSVVLLAKSPDGRHLAVHDPDGGVRVIDRSTGRDEAVVEGHRGRLEKATFSPDGSRLAILGRGWSLGLWDASSGGLIRRYDDESGTIQSFQFSPDGTRLAAAVDDAVNRKNEIRFYDAVDGRPLASVTKPRVLGQSHAIFSFSPDGRCLVTNFHENELRVWSATDGSLLGSLRGHTAMITAVAFSPDGGQIASGAANGSIRLWNSRTFSGGRELLGHASAVSVLAFRPDGETLASGSDDGSVRIWSRTAAEPLAVLPDHRGMTAVAFSPDGRQLAVAAQGGESLDLWDALKVKRLRALVGPGGTVSEVVYSPDGAVVAAAFKIPERAGEVRVWGTDTGEQLSVLGPHERGAERVAFSPDGTRLLTTSGDGVATLWNPRTGSRLVSVASGYGGVFADASAVFGLDGRRMAYRMPSLIDTQTGEPLGGLLPQGNISCLGVSPDGRLVAVGMSIGTVYLAEFATAKRYARLVGHAAAVRAISFNVDGTLLLTGSMDGSARLWNAQTGQEIRLYHGHEGSVEKVMFSPDERRIITAATDGTTRIWDPRQGNELCVLPGQQDFPRAVALSPDGMRLVVASSDGRVRIWGLSNAAITTARQALTDPR